MKHLSVLIVILSALFLMAACGNHENSGNENASIITEKIEYPVFIKDPYGDNQADWWKENIETSKRLEFVQTLFDWAYSGEVKAYDYLTNKPLTVEQVKAIGNEPDTLTIIQSFPPYEEKDTILQNKIDLHLIHKLKFMEEWRFNLKDHSIQKTVIGIAPTLTVYADSMEIKGYRPLFWIYFDEEYAKKNETK